MNKKILVILPTRKRVDKTVEAIQAWLDTKAGGYSDMLVCLDDDDPNLPDYKKALDDTFGGRDLGDMLNVVVDGRIRMCPTVNRAFAQFPEYEYYCFIGDDHRFRTRGWDKRAIYILDTHTDGWGVWYPDDMLQHEKLASTFVISGKLAREVGFIAVPGTKHMYMDNFVMSLGKSILRLYYDPEVKVEHMHYTVQKSEVDAQYLEVNAQEIYSEDKAFFDKWEIEEREKTAERILEKIKTEKEANGVQV